MVNHGISAGWEERRNKAAGEQCQVHTRVKELLRSLLVEGVRRKRR